MVKQVTAIGVALVLVAHAGLALCASAALATEPSVDADYSKTFSACMDAAGGSTLPMRDCMSAEHDRWDKALNQAYRARMASRDGAAKVRLSDEERAWLKSTARKCDHAGDDEAGGSLQGIDIDQCYLDETIRRTLYLRALR